MCGIFSILNNNEKLLSNVFIEEQFQKGKGRGPESSSLQNVMIKTLFGFHRLAINGLNPESDQPIIDDNIALICNGEIYNYQELYEFMGEEPSTDSDCEVIIHLYRKYGMEQTLQMLDGVFAFVLVDYRLTDEDSKIFIARDPYGVRPLYEMSSQLSIDPIFAFASELKELSEIRNKLNRQKSTLINRPTYHIRHFTPGTYSEYHLAFKVTSAWILVKSNVLYHLPGFQSTMVDKEHIFSNIQYYLRSAVEKRCIATERPIACLLSGGLDSSLITALVMEYQRANNLPPIETYSIGLAGSVDLHHAKIVADFLGTRHTEVILTEQDFLDAIPAVIQSIESYDTTTVRASIGNWLLGQYIAKNSEAKVIFNGDGADELMGGYLYMQKAPDAIEFDKETRRLLTDIHAFDVLRSDKSISSHGLEPRTPFLDRSWVQYYMSIPILFRCDRTLMEKSLIRTAFTGVLPNEILWRKKEAFSDGVSKTSRSLYEIIQDYTNSLPEFKDNDNQNLVDKCKKDPRMSEVGSHLLPTTTEQYWYRMIFEQHYPGMGKIVPYFWMPKYVKAKDASARTLAIYG